MFGNNLLGDVVELGTGVRGASSPGAGPGPYKLSWPGMAARPYLRPAWDQHRREVIGVTSENVAVVL